MTPLPGILGKGEIVGWRLDHRRFATTWDSGQGAFKFGGRWNSKGVIAVYASLDASTAILEVAVHKGFRVFDTVPHMLTSFVIADPDTIHVVWPADIPNPNWLTPGIPGAGQQEFGDHLMAANAFVAIPSVVSNRSWNLLFNPVRVGDGSYALRSQDDFGSTPGCILRRAKNRFGPASPFQC